MDVVFLKNLNELVEVPGSAHEYLLHASVLKLGLHFLHLMFVDSMILLVLTFPPTKIRNSNLYLKVQSITEIISLIVIDVTK